MPSRVGRGLRLRQVSCAATTALLFLAACSSTHAPGRHRVADERGKVLDSAFAGVLPSPRLRELSRQFDNSTRSMCTKGKESLWERLGRLVHVTSVSAASCTAGSCGGAYMIPDSKPCGGGGCTSDEYYWYYSDPMYGRACDGWKYTGNTVCAGCICEENTCTPVSSCCGG